MKSGNGSGFVGTKEAAAHLNVGTSTIQRWIDAGRLRAYRTAGGHRRIKKKDLIKFAVQQGMPHTLIDDEFPTILIVDDDAEINEILKDFIMGRYPGVKVLTATGGVEAGLLLDRAVPTLVLLDIYMPGVDGIELCKIIRNDKKLRKTRVVGITAFRDEEKLRTLRAAGAEKIIFKPFNDKELEALLKKYLGVPRKPRSLVEDERENHLGNRS